MPTRIVAERPDTVEAALLIRELDGYLEPLYPRESRHGFPVEQLLREAVAVMRHERDTSRLWRRAALWPGIR